MLFENSLEPSECIYLDNLEKNVKLASDLGLKASLFEEIESVKKALKEKGVI